MKCYPISIILRLVLIYLVRPMNLRYAQISDEMLREECEEEDGSLAESESSDESEDDDDGFGRKLLTLQEQVCPPITNLT